MCFHLHLDYYNFYCCEEPENSLDKNNLIDLKKHDKSDVVKVASLDAHEKSKSLSSHKSNISLPVPSTSTPHNSILRTALSKSSLANNSLNNFSSRTIKHHTFDSGFQDVKNMEKNLISLLDDFHNGEHGIEKILM